jgi:type II secretory pathway pseudopilin PulG
MKISKTAIFLFELMIVILIFSLAAAICTSVFGKAYGFSEDSKALTMAVLRAESVAEQFKAGKTLEEIEAMNIPEGEPADSANPYISGTFENAVLVAYDGDWEPVRSNGKPVYGVVAFTADEGDMRILDIWVSKLKDKTESNINRPYIESLDKAEQAVTLVGERMPGEPDELIYRLKVKSYDKK